MDIKVNTSAVNQTRHFARIDEPDLLELIACAVAKAAGQPLPPIGQRDTIRIERCFISSNDTSTGPPKATRHSSCSRKSSFVTAGAHA